MKGRTESNGESQLDQRLLVIVCANMFGNVNAKELYDHFCEDDLVFDVFIPWNKHRCFEGLWICLFQDGMGCKKSY